MSVDITQYFGYTVTLTENMTRKESDEYYELLEKYPEIWDESLVEDKPKSRLIIDGMAETFARLIYILSEKEIPGWIDEDDKTKNETLKSVPVPDEAFDELAEYYKKLTGTKLKKEQVTLQEWHLWH